MDCYLHIGTEKTGSSYLQSIAAINRELLRQQGIWYPYAGNREEDMIAGRISPGNAQALTDALSDAKKNKVQSLIGKWVQEAKNEKCNRLLLSNELLAIVLSKRDSWEALNQAIKAHEIGEVNYLLVLRDPVDLALSLYKHRSKWGEGTEIEKWIVQDFEYVQAFERFFQLVDQLKPTLTCRKYETTKGSLEEMFFKDWLGVNDTLKLPQGKVNHSLNLSELTLIRSLKSHHSYLPEVLYNRFLRIPHDHKADESRMETYFRSVIAQELIKHKLTWERCQIALSEDERLNFPESVLKIDPISKVVTLSEIQVDILNGLLGDSVSLKFLGGLIWLRTRRWLGRIKKRMVS